MDMRLNSDDQWKTFLGEDFIGLGGKGSKHETPKMKVPAHRYVHEGFLEANRLKLQNLTVTGSLARGGVSQMWGAGAFCYRDEDLQRFPVSHAALLPSYQEVARRIGISGVADDALGPRLGDDIPLQKPLDLHPAASVLLNRFESRRQTPRSFVLGRTRNAVATEALPGRSICKLENKCMWGCAHGAIYSADQDLQQLLGHHLFQYRPGSFVENLQPISNGYRLFCRDLDGKQPTATVDCSTLILAAGTVATSALVLRSFMKPGDELPFFCHPAFAMAFVVPQRIGKRWSDKGFALGHLAYVQEDGEPDDYAFGVVFSMEGILATDIVKHMPLSHRGGMQLARLLMPSFLVANCYLSSRYASGAMKLLTDGSVSIRGAHTGEFELKKKRVARKVAAEFLRLGAVMMPTSLKTAQLGSDAHFVGTFPMRSSPKRWETDEFGELHGYPNLHIVDGSILPSMSAKHPTFTFMANADRIGRRVASRLKADG